MKKLLSLLLILPLLAVPAGISAQEGPAAPPDDVAAALDGVLDGLITGLEGQIPGSPGAVLLVRTPDWEYLQAAGTTTLDGPEPITPDMPFQVGSNTKMMTATIILQLHEEGLLDIDDPLSNYLPEIAARIPNGAEVTVRQLLSHRSGIWDYVDGSRPAPGSTEKPEDGLFYVALADPEVFQRDYTPEELVDYAIEHGHPEFAPGSLDEDGEPNFAYCNTGYVLLGMIIEAVTGQPIEDVFAARIFEPLGMTNSFFETGVAPEGLTPRGYWEGQDVTDFNLSMAWTAGAVISTAGEMATFITALLHGDLYQDPATLNLMQSEPRMFAPTGGNYALGLQDKAYGDGLWGHGGQTLAFESDVVYDVEAQMAIVAWTNTGSSLAAYAGGNVRQARLNLGAPQPISLDDLLGTELGLIQAYNATDGLTAFDPAAPYTLTFAPYGGLAIQADCNQATGSYVPGGGQTLTIMLGVTTLAACGPDSFADTFLEYLSTTTNYTAFADDTTLTVILLTADGNSLSLTATP